MKNCPKCNNQHEKSGIYCSRQCANSRSFSALSKEKKKISNLKYWENVPDSTRAKYADHARKLGQSSLGPKAKQVARELRISSADFDTLNINEKRERVLREQNNQCLECGIGEVWNGKPLKLELDHIDGNNSNNVRENLRFICPNCHQQTPTYKGKRNASSVKYTDEQIINALKSNTSGYSALKALGMNLHGGNYVRLRNIVKRYNLDLGYNV